MVHLSRYQDRIGGSPPRRRFRNLLSTCRQDNRGTLLSNWPPHLASTCQWGRARTNWRMRLARTSTCRHRRPRNRFQSRLPAWSSTCPPRSLCTVQLSTHQRPQSTFRRDTLDKSRSRELQSRPSTCPRRTECRWRWTTALLHQTMCHIRRRHMLHLTVHPL